MYYMNVICYFISWNLSCVCVSCRPRVRNWKTVHVLTLFQIKLEKGVLLWPLKCHVQVPLLISGSSPWYKTAIRRSITSKKETTHHNKSVENYEIHKQKPETFDISCMKRTDHDHKRKSNSCNLSVIHVSCNKHGVFAMQSTHSW